MLIRACNLKIMPKNELACLLKSIFIQDERIAKWKHIWTFPPSDILHAYYHSYCGKYFKAVINN